MEVPGMGNPRRGNVGGDAFTLPDMDLSARPALFTRYYEGGGNC